MLRNWPPYFIGLGLIVVLMVGCEPKQSGVKKLGQLLWGQHQERIQLSREEAVAKHDYCPTGGCIIRLEKVQINPIWVRPGDTVTLTASYTILTPERVRIPITITQEVRFQGKTIGQVKVIQTRQPNGTWVSKDEIHLPPNTRTGDYTLITKVSTGYGMDQKSVDFKVM